MLTRCLFWRDVAVHLLFSNFLCHWPSVDPVLSTAPYDQKDLCVSCRTYTSVESLTTKTAGPLKRRVWAFVDNPLLHDITGSFASCYKSHRLPTCLRLLHYVVLLHDFNVSFKVLPLLSRISLLAVVPWRHHLVMILWLNSQQKRFCDASKRVRPLMGASDLRRIYNNILIPYASHLVYSHRPTMKVGDHTTVQTVMWNSVFTRSSAIAQRPRGASCKWKFC